MRGRIPVLGTPVDLMSEAGRGLAMIAALSAEFNVTRRPEPPRGSHARAVLSVNRETHRTKHDGADDKAACSR